MMKMKKLLQLFVLSLAVAMASICSAQTVTARLTGTITDPNGAAVVGATVSITNTATGQVSTAQTNDQGYYVVPALTPGQYHEEVTQKGFDKVNRDFELQVSQIAVVDFQLTIGTINESITVTGGSPVIDAADSSVSTVIQGRQITELPLNGRNFTQLATLVPGVNRGIPTGSNSATGVNNNAETFRFGEEGGASLAVNGSRPQDNNFILDGIDNNESLVNTIIFFPPADAIEEFKVQTSLAPAEFGRAGGALVV